MKRAPEIVALVLFAFLVLTGCTSASARARERFLSAHPSFQGIENVYQEQSASRIMDDLTDDGVHAFVLVFDPASYECPYCATVLPLLNEVALASGLERIDVLDIYAMRMKTSKSYTRLLEAIASQVTDLALRDGVTTLIVPDFYVVKDGVIKGHHIATLLDESGNYKKTLSSDEEEELKGLYQELIASVS